MDPGTHARTTLQTLLLLASLIGCSQTTGESQRPALIVDVEHGQLFGAVHGESWLLPDDAVALVQGVSRFSFYTNSGLLGQCTIPLEWHQKEICAQPALDIHDCAAHDETAVAIAGSWNAAPRLPESLHPGHPIYRELLSTWLRSQSIDNRSPPVDQLLRIDLEGDGVNEILISATRHRGNVRSAHAGDYSITLLRSVVHNTVRTFPLQQDLYQEACEAECEPTTSRVVAVLDVNGDGILEIITEVKSFESVKRTIFSVHEGGTQARLSWSCGV